MRKKIENKRNNFNEGWMVSDHIMPQPSQFSIRNLKSFNSVELWYFTDEGCNKAQDPVTRIWDSILSLSCLLPIT
jgi:hypothetical protein